MLEELKSLNIQSGRDEIIYFLCNVVGTSPITRNDAMVLCSHAPGKHHLSCDDLMVYCAAFGWIIILDNTLLLVDDLKEYVEHGRQINDYLIKSAVNLLFDSDILTANMFFYDSVQSQYGFKNELSSAGGGSICGEIPDYERHWLGRQDGGTFARNRVGVYNMRTI